MNLGSNWVLCIVWDDQKCHPQASKTVPGSHSQNRILRSKWISGFSLVASVRRPSALWGCRMGIPSIQNGHRVPISWYLDYLGRLKLSTMYLLVWNWILALSAEHPKMSSIWTALSIANLDPVPSKDWLNREARVHEATEWLSNFIQPNFPVKIP